MKAAITFIILAVITASVRVLGEEKKVLDINGDPVIIGKPYYIKPVYDFGEGVRLSFFRPDLEHPCPQLAVLSGSPLISPREPVAFYTEESVHTQEFGGFVYESTQLLFDFQRMDDFCPGQTGHWKLNHLSEDLYPQITGKGHTDQGSDPFEIKKWKGRYLIYYYESDVRVRKHRIGEEIIYYLEVSPSGDLFQVDFVPVTVDTTLSVKRSVFNRMASNGTKVSNRKYLMS
ncbi:hypothetical protein AALP_AAs75074U000100 [Arabis alpina]|uniref:Uncharacterized protein n=1 Tax=Arabis alpina TaxID=50452 RepID=A0A087G3B6_ARAAL|nr:hypothetical protein AALP_AAs75074U000100 [Arabis alpina]